MRTMTRLFLALLLIPTIGCDPAMTIRQAESRPRSLTDFGVAINVKASHPFTGENWYAPIVEIANSSDSPITVTKVELAVRQDTVENKPRRSGTYPLQVPAGSTEGLDIWFDLTTSVKKTFQLPCELRVYYRTGSAQRVSQATLIGGRLDAAVP